MLFTAQPTPRHQSSSRLFQSYGANNLAPAPVTDSRIFPILSDSTAASRSAAWKKDVAVFVSLALGVDVATPSQHFNSAFATTHESANILFDVPLAVTSFNKPSETLVSQVEDAGYKRTSLGRYSFFQGEATEKSIKKLVSLGGELYAYAPQDRVSFGGAMALYMIRRLLYFIFCSQALIKAGPLKDSSQKGSATLPSFLHKVVDDLPLGTKGHFLPYFSGLCLPDKSTIYLILDIFQRCLGDSGTARERTNTVLVKGWNSLHNTTSGRIISHMMFGINVARQGGFLVLPCFDNGDYNGLLLLGTSSVLYNGLIVDPVDEDDLQREVHSMASHENTLLEIIAILKLCKLKGSGDKKLPERDIDISMITTPRALHYLCADRIVDESDQAEIVKNHIKKLRFQQTFFKALDRDNLLIILEALVSKQRLDIHVPFDLAGGALFSNSHTLSCLSAYGPIAPSPIDSSKANSAVTLREGFTKGTTQGTLGGIPLFARPVQQAVEDWKTLKKTGTLSFQVKGRTNYGSMKIANIGTIITADTTEGQQCHKLFIRFGKRADKKRQRKEDSDMWGDEFTGISTMDAKSAISHETKKRKVASEATGLFDTMGW